jgi:anti-sigma factor RsiW
MPAVWRIQMRPDDLLLSAYLDGEVPEKYVSEIEDSIETDPGTRARLDALKALRDKLHAVPVPAMEERMVLAYASIARRASVNPRSPVGFRWKQIQLPLPAVAAAAVALVAIAAVAIWSLMPRTPASAPDYLAQGKDVDVTIRVDDADMERVLQWLVDQQMLGEVSIQLPEQQFEIVGDPVLLKPDDYPEGFTE